MVKVREKQLLRCFSLNRKFPDSGAYFSTNINVFFETNRKVEYHLCVFEGRENLHGRIRSYQILDFIYTGVS